MLPILAQVLTLVEHAVLLYRALLPTPVWVRYFEGAGLGSVLTACYTGASRLPPAPSGSLAITFASECWLCACGHTDCYILHGGSGDGWDVAASVAACRGACTQSQHPASCGCQYSASALTWERLHSALASTHAQPVLLLLA